MNILILQGPNLNLLGLKSAQMKERLTLDRLNKKIKTEVKLMDVRLKFLQTHKSFQAINFLQIKLQGYFLFRHHGQEPTTQF